MCIAKHRGNGASPAHTVKVHVCPVTLSANCHLTLWPAQRGTGMTQLLTMALSPSALLLKLSIQFYNMQRMSLYPELGVSEATGAVILALG